MSDVLTNIARPKTSATLTVRIIKSFEYRTERSLVLHEVNLETCTVGQLKDIARKAVLTQSGWKPYRNVTLGSSMPVFNGYTLKLYTKAHGSKTTNLIINLENDDWILDEDHKTLADLSFGMQHMCHFNASYPNFRPENETEVSFFNRELYEHFKRNPTTSWD
ncbi:hypothetical protein D9615_001769 [Tricholomella constricta]|uniref:Uncharacterized protein n=1 Tax=Tricholomella constricta TaxID=117010 RepID=A0A8H5MAC3_9AGAR|nr:hypothetical protein D9615_001769 [Tricholomella constricta]